MFKAIVVLLHMYDYIIFPVQYLLIQFFVCQDAIFRIFQVAIMRNVLYTQTMQMFLWVGCAKTPSLPIYLVWLIFYSQFTQILLKTAYFSDSAVTCYNRWQCIFSQILWHYCMLKQVTMHIFSDFAIALAKLLKIQKIWKIEHKYISFPGSHTKRPITKHPITKHPITKHPITKHPITKHPSL